ncbi:MAG: PAS domain-containing protein [Lentisphaerae bacterium]|nr:PAS domain-containing protein [Lentisphaerota bacterium]
MDKTTASETRCETVAKSLLAGAVMSAGNGVTIADARRPDMPLIFVNPAFEHITGYPSREVIGRNCRFLQGRATRQRGLTTVRRALTAGRRCSVVLENFRKDGARFWNELYLAPIRDRRGNVTHFVGIQNDVTRRIEAEQAETRLRRKLRAGNRALQAANEQKNALLGMAAHDIRNPLAVIMLCVEMLTPRPGKTPDRKMQAKMLGRIKQNAQFMLQMVNDLLDVTKIDAGTLSLECAACDLRTLIRERMPMYRHSAAAKGVTVQSRCAPALPPAYADGARITQVLDNLVSNAVKFSHPRSPVTIRAQREDNALRVAVIDRGQGIPEDERQRLFEPFSRTSVRGTAGESSTGLGLAICRKIVEGHPGGRIDVESEFGKGSTFSFRLPVYRA